MTDAVIIEGNSLAIMRECAEGEADVFDAIVTSPPYADQRRYDGTGQRVTERANRNGRTPGSKNQSRRQRSEAPMVYATETFPPFLDAMAGVLKPDGALMLNLGVVMRDGEESPYADEILAHARRTGWCLLHRMIWHKPNGNVLSDPRFLTVSHEWVFWLARSVDAYRGYDRDTRRAHAAASLRRIEQPFLDSSDRPGDERYEKRSRKGPMLHPDGARPSTVFTAGVGGRVNGKGTNHPAVMPLPLALQLVSLSCPPGGRVLDPFAGAGTTGIACRRRGRHFVGIEIEAEYAAEARQRIHDDAPLLGPDPLDPAQAGEPLVNMGQLTF